MAVTPTRGTRGSPLSLLERQKMGGQARAAALTPQRRREIASIAAQIRWDREKTPRPSRRARMEAKRLEAGSTALSDALAKEFVGLMISDDAAKRIVRRIIAAVDRVQTEPNEGKGMRG